jgi:hypothetical protein
MRAFKGTVAAALTALLLAAPGASAATEAGDDCVGNVVEANRTMIAWNSGSFSMNRVVGEPGGVITAWKVRLAAGHAPMAERLETYRGVNETPEEIHKEAESSLETVREGENVFKTRLPVHPSAQLGVYGPAGTFACETGESVATGSFEGSAAVGETRAVTGMIGFRTPVVAVVEPDADGDGYGDETQDLCPQGAALQVACPAVTIRTGAVARKKSIVVLVGVSSEARVEVFGQVGWGYKPKPGVKTTRIIAALTGPKRSVAAGKPSFFTVPLPKIVQRRLAKLSSQESLKAKIKVSVKDLTDRETIRRLTVKLTGWKR